MDAPTYLQSRVDDQINWMEGKSTVNQKYYKQLKMIEILAAALIPFLAGMHGVNIAFSIATGLLGVLIVVINGIQQLYKYRENWLNYRITIERLRREKMLFENNSGIYSGADAYPKFVENFEALLANENKVWQTNMVERSEQKKSE